MQEPMENSLKMRTDKAYKYIGRSRFLSAEANVEVLVGYAARTAAERGIKCDIYA